MAVLPDMGRRGFLLSSLAAAGCGRARKTDVRKLSVAVGSYHTMSPAYLAHERGYFREAGLDVTLHPVRNGPEAMPLLAQGTLDAGLFSTSPALCNMIAQGARIRIAAAREFMTNCIDVGVLYESKKAFPSGDQEAHSWRGKRIALQSRGVIAEFAFDTVRKGLGLPAEAVHPLYMDRATGLAALLSGGVDAMVNGFAFAIDMGQRRDEFIRNDTAPRVLHGMQYSYIVFSKSLVDGDTELGADFLRAYFRGTREYLAGATPVFLENWVRDNGMDRDMVIKGCRDTFVPDGSVSLADLQKYVDWLAERSYIQPMKAGTMADSRWLDRAHGKRS